MKVAIRVLLERAADISEIIIRGAICVDQKSDGSLFCECRQIFIAKQARERECGELIDERFVPSDDRNVRYTGHS